mgnify:CR=1 FL=1
MKVLFAIILFCLAMPAFSNLLVGKVDIQKVLITVKEGKKVRAKLKGVFEKKKKILDVEQKKIQKLQEDFKKQSLVMNDKAKLDKERKLQQMIIRLQQKSLGFQKEIQQMENKMKKPILEKLRGIINTVSKKAGVDLTFESSTAPVVYAKKQQNLTNEVISLYNKKYSK